MSCKDKQIPLATDIQLTSMTDGAKTIYWIDQAFWSAFQGAAAIEIFLNIMQIRGTGALVRFVAENAEDPNGFEPLIQTAAAPTYIDNGTGYFTAERVYYQFTGQPYMYRRLMRVGIEVSATATYQAVVRLSASIRIRAVAAPQAVSKTTTLANGAQTLDISDTLDTAAFIKGRLFIKMSANVGGAEATINFYTGNDSSRFYLVGSATIAIGASTASILVDGLGLTAKRRSSQRALTTVPAPLQQILNCGLNRRADADAILAVALRT